MEQDFDSRPDRQLSGMSGEFLVIGKLFQYGLQASLTLGNAKSVDIFVHNPFTRKNFAVQVKTLRYRNVFIIDKKDILSDNIYIFVCLNEPADPENYFIWKGEELKAREKELFGTKEYAIPGINFSQMLDHEGRWSVFFEGMSDFQYEMYQCFGVKAREAKVRKRFTAI